MGLSLNRPGVTIEQFMPIVDKEFRTGVVGFLAPVTGAAPPADPVAETFTSWHDFVYRFRDGKSWRQDWHPDGVLWSSVQGFFANGGLQCHIVFYDPATGDPLAALDRAVERLSNIDEVDVVCAPSLTVATDPLALQRKLIDSSERWRRENFADWFMILDAPPPSMGQDLALWLDSLRIGCARPHDIAVYHPWLLPGGDWEPPPSGNVEAVPPSGFVAGIYARTDQRVGVHKPPANEEILGVVDVTSEAPEIETANALLALPGRGIRVWGARTLAFETGKGDPSTFVNTRRLIMTLERWLVRALEWVVFETNDFRLWVRIHRELEDKLTQLFQRGAFAGKSPTDAFRIKCDDENNSAEARANGLLQIDIDVAPALPQHFIKIRLIRSAGTLTVS